MKKKILVAVLSVAFLVLIAGAVRAAADPDTISVGVTVNPTISIDAPADPTIAAITGTGTSSGDTTWNVITNNSAGYKLEWQASAATMASGSDTIAAYTPAVANTPETWSVAATDSEWGARLKSVSTDAAAEWGTDTTLEKWLNVNNAAVRSVVTRATETDVAGSNEIFTWQITVGASKFQPTGTYTVNVTATATTL